MAWLSVGSSNLDLLEKMVENEVLTEGSPIYEAFRHTDRGDFVADGDRTQGFMDRPYKKNKIHMSAPHMYHTVLDALDLQPGKSFLNVGSGSGYLSCLAAFLLGEGGVTHGIEVHESMVEYSREKVSQWYAKLRAEAGDDDSIHRNISLENISFVHGNCFDIDVNKAVKTFKYDRIYVGAGCPEKRKEFFLSLLADDGILVVPVNESNQMVSLRKFCGRVYNMTHISNVHFAPLVDTSERVDEVQHLSLALGETARDEESLEDSLLFSIMSADPRSSSFIIHPTPPAITPAIARQTPPTSSSSSSVLSMEIETAAASQPAVASSTTGSTVNGTSNSNWEHDSTTAVSPSTNTNRVSLPSLVWTPLRSRHMQFPSEYRAVVLTILLANNRFSSSSSSSCCSRGFQQHHHHQQPRPYTSGSRSSGSGYFLPHQMWLHVFSFANREWFTQPKSNTQILASELAVERRMRQNAEIKLKQAEEARRSAERERDLFRSVMMRLSRHRRNAAAALTTAFIEVPTDDEEEEQDDDEEEDEEEDDDYHYEEEEQEEEVEEDVVEEEEEEEEEVEEEDEDEDEEEEEEEEVEDREIGMIDYPSGTSAFYELSENIAFASSSSSSSSSLFVPPTYSSAWVTMGEEVVGAASTSVTGEGRNEEQGGADPVSDTAATSTATTIPVVMMVDGDAGNQHDDVRQQQQQQQQQKFLLGSAPIHPLSNPLPVPALIGQAVSASYSSSPGSAFSSSYSSYLSGTTMESTSARGSNCSVTNPSTLIADGSIIHNSGNLDKEENQDDSASTAADSMTAGGESEDDEDEDGRDSMTMMMVHRMSTPTQHLCVDGNED